MPLGSSERLKLRLSFSHVCRGEFDVSKETYDILVPKGYPQERTGTAFSSRSARGTT